MQSKTNLLSRFFSSLINDEGTVGERFLLVLLWRRCRAVGALDCAIGLFKSEAGGGGRVDSEQSPVLGDME